MGKFTKGIARKGARKAPKKVFTLICEGKNTEPEYFDALARKYCGALVRVTTIGGAGVPLTIAERAVKHKEKLNRRGDSWIEHDEVWAVFDRDDHPGFFEAIRKCEDARVGVARSIPCFELWILLHFEDYDRPGGRTQVQKRLRELEPAYNPSKGKRCDFHKVCQTVKTAVHRSLLQVKRRNKERSVNGDPSTTVGELVRAILTASDQWSKP